MPSRDVAEMLTEAIVADQMSVEDARSAFLRFYRRKRAAPYVPVTCEIQKLADLERDAVTAALAQLPPIEAARALGVSKTQIYRKIKEYGLKRVWASREAQQ